MYPNYKESAVNSLMSEFIRLVCYQTGKMLFGESGMIGLDTRYATPAYFTTRSIINIARLLREMPKPKGWHEKDLQKVYDLAAAAEQREADDPDHLLHIMQSVLYECRDGNCGRLSVDIIEEEKGILTVWLEEQVTGEPVIDWMGKVPVTDNDNTTYYKIRAVTAHYNEDAGDWNLTFRAQRLSDGATVELPGNTLTADAKKEIADYMIEEASKEPTYNKIEEYRKLYLSEAESVACDVQSEIQG